MKKSNLGKKLLAVVTAAVMMVGCVATVSAYTPTSADTKALDIKGIIVSAVNEDDDVKKAQLTMTADLADKLGTFYAMYPSAATKYIFGLKGSVDSDDGTSIRVACFMSSKKVAAFQWNSDDKVWDKLSVSKSTDFLRFKVKSRNPIIITDNNPSKKKISKLTLSAKKLELEPGEKVQLSITQLTPSSYSTFKREWESSNKGVASVSKTGLVTAKKKGTASISLTIAGKKVTCSVKVLKKVTDIDISGNVTEVSAGKTATLRASIVPSNATNKGIKWEITNKRGKKIASLTNKTDKKCKLKIKKTAESGDVINVRVTSKGDSKIKKTMTIKVV
ncbi:MAG: Ig-like domain-containing protein [Lachnospiraceae bacterium]|nr:Ig-like domain-containing protein [Lachnospiraceae bacterium]